jgi:hypothetical protein
MGIGTTSSFRSSNRFRELVTDHPGHKQPHGPLAGRPQLIEEARRHQRRRRGITGAALVTMLGIGGLVVVLSLGGADEHGRTVGTTASVTTPTQGQSRPSATETSSPASGSVLTSEGAAALQAAQKAAAAAENAAASGNIRSSPPRGAVQGQAASQAAIAEAQAAAAAAAAAAAQSEHH